MLAEGDAAQERGQTEGVPPDWRRGVCPAARRPGRGVRVQSSPHGPSLAGLGLQELLHLDDLGLLIADDLARHGVRVRVLPIF